MHASNEGELPSESCIWVNLLSHFMFEQFRDTATMKRCVVRIQFAAIFRWVLKRLQMELNDVASRSAANKIIHDVQIRDLQMGSHFPTVKSIRVNRADLDESSNRLLLLDLLLNIDYSGGARVAVDVTSLLSRKAFLSVQV